jgi:hypothetical protein
MGLFLHFFFRPYPRCCRLTLELAHTDPKSLFEQMIWPDRRFGSVVGAYVSREKIGPIREDGLMSAQPHSATWSQCRQFQIVIRL